MRAILVSEWVKWVKWVKWVSVVAKWNGKKLFNRWVSGMASFPNYCHGRDKTKCYLFRSLVVSTIVKKKKVFAGIIGRSLVQKIHKNINNLISSPLCTKLCWTDTKKYKNLVLSGRKCACTKSATGQPLRFFATNREFKLHYNIARKFAQSNSIAQACFIFLLSRLMMSINYS